MEGSQLGAALGELRSSGLQSPARQGIALWERAIGTREKKSSPGKKGDDGEMTFFYLQASGNLALLAREAASKPCQARAEGRSARTKQDSPFARRRARH